jgi:predicted ATPase
VQHPTVVVADDLHWADPASVELFVHLLALVEEVPIVFILAFRPERQSAAWQLKVKAETDYPHRYSEIVLKPLGDSAADQLVSELLDIADLPPELRRLILRKADGNPYFVEEIVRSLIDDGIVVRDADGLHWRSSAKLEDIAIPDNLQALLMSRIDRLDQETKATLQVASVIGRSFYYRILNAISDSAIELDKHLGSLERVELVREAGRRPELEYVFRHELARDAAYGSILNRRRREFHRQVGEAIETVFADRIEDNAHRLAQHFSLAGDHAKAAKYYEMAGDTAAAMHALDESETQYSRAAEAARQGGLEDAAHRVEAKRLALRRSGSVPGSEAVGKPT